MASPAQAFRQRAEAKKHSANESQDAVNANAYEKQLMQLNEHRAQLKAIQSTEKKADRKREILPTYLPWIKGVLESGSGRQDDVFITVMVWAIDAGQWDMALAMAAYAIEHKLVMPDQYKRTTAVVIAEEIADAAKAKPEAVPLETLQETQRLTDPEDMPDQVRAKLMKSLGVALTATEDLQGAVDAYTRALQLNDKAGCKKDLEKLQAQLKKSQDNKDNPQNTPPST